MTSCVWQSLKVLVALGALVGYTHSARAETSVASLGVRSLDGEDELERRLSGALRSGARSIGDFSVGDREQSLEQMLLAQGCEDPDAKCLSQIAATLTVDKLLYGTVIDSAGAYELTLYMFDASSKNVETMAAHGIPPELLSPVNVGDTVDKVLRRLLGKDEPADPTPVASTGKLRIEGGVPGATITVDGVDAGVIDDQGVLVLDLAEGRHVVRPDGAGFSQSDERVVEVATGHESTLRLAALPLVALDDEKPPSLDEPPPPPARSSTKLRRYLGYGTIGVGVVLAIATVYSWARISHINHDDSYKEYRAAFPKAGSPGGVSNVCGPAKRGELTAQDESNRKLESKANDLCNQADTLEVLQYVFLGGTVVAGGVGTYLVLSSRDKPSAPASTLSVNPRFGAQSAGLAATLSF